MRVFLDANILFSAAKSNGAVRRLLEMLLRAGHECVVDAYVMEEARRNLAAKSPASVEALRSLSSHLTNVPLPAAQAALRTDAPLPPDDWPILASAIYNRCDALVTGDRTHFGPLYGSFEGVAIHSPRSLAEALGFAASAGAGNELHAPKAKYRVRRKSR